MAIAIDIDVYFAVIIYNCKKKQSRASSRVQAYRCWTQSTNGTTRMNRLAIRGRSSNSRVFIHPSIPSSSKSNQQERMEQPPGVNAAENNNNNKQKEKKKSKRMASPRELVSHYEKQGMETQEASLKVIQDLQGALFRMITANRNNRNANSPDITSAKLDAIHSRLLQLEMKVDSKPSYPPALALGVASAGIWNAALQLWNTVTRPTHSD
ncbi:hypothetical protein BUALT_Bualt07G0177200 [Buddleja alternifolia]|uniref:Uncharacterized protein n=1 Tax=Buddleja alternifolia TaxID=168488 RepID=A0AAV6XCR2_9LAMI|nr:hypothetical protein BUALT_Bualt07G0177200 [Buddleja alternifolia]